MQRQLIRRSLLVGIGLGEGWFLFVVQVHKHNDFDPELVQGGQLLAMYVHPQIGR